MIGDRHKGKGHIMHFTESCSSDFPVPAKVWSLNDIQQKEEADALSVALDSQAEQRWWEFQELQKLVIANNCIAEIPVDIQKLSCLQILDVRMHWMQL